MVGDDQRIGAVIDGHLGILRIEDTLERNRAAPDRLRPFDVFPRHRLVELRVDVTGDGEERILPGLHQAGRHDFRTGQVTPYPARTHRKIQQVGNIQRRRNGQAVMHVAVALALQRQVHRQHQRRTSRGLCAFDEFPRHAAVAHHIELKPGRLFRDLLDIFHCRGGHRTQAETGAGIAGRTRRFECAIRPEQPGHAGRRENQRQIILLAQYRDGLVPYRNIAQHVLHERDVVEVLLIRPQRHFVLRSAVDIVEQHAGKTLPRQLAQV